MFVCREIKVIKVYIFSFNNPFRPGGCISEDADLMLRMWKEKRLTEFFETENREEEDELDAQIKKNENKDKCDVSDELVKRKDGNSFRPKIQVSSLCCSVM